jgi:peptide/nickel transport system substrate-binding protein
LALALAAPAAVPAKATPADTLVVGGLADPSSLHPHEATDLLAAEVVGSVCETLVRARAEGSRPEAVLATTWATKDRRTWTFTLREGVRFQDGAPFDADAVVANIESLRRRRAFPGKASRLGPWLVELVLDRPSAALLTTLSQPFFSMQSPQKLDVSHPVGTGPFRFVSSKPGLVELEASPGHRGEPRHLRHLLFRRCADEDALVHALNAGEVDVTTALPEATARHRLDDAQLHIDVSTGLNVSFLSLNNERPPFHDRRVRQALARAIDREAVVRLLGGGAVPARNPLPPLISGYDALAKPLREDRHAARRLLEEAGFGAGFATTLMTVATPRPYLPQPLRVAERIESDLAQIAVTVTPHQAASWAEYLDKAARGDYDMALLGWQADTTDANDFLSALLASEAVGTTNRSRYKSAEMDSLLKRGRMTADPEDREAIYRQAQELFRRDLPWIPLYHGSVITAVRRVVRGLVTAPTGVTRYDQAWKTE